MMANGGPESPTYAETDQSGDESAGNRLFGARTAEAEGPVGSARRIVTQGEPDQCTYRNATNDACAGAFPESASTGMIGRQVSQAAYRFDGCMLPFAQRVGPPNSDRVHHDITYLHFRQRIGVSHHCNLNLAIAKRVVQKLELIKRKSRIDRS